MKRMMALAWALLGVLGCETRELKLCDIVESDCQESIYYADLRVRGDGYDPFGGIPPIRTISEDQYRNEMQAEAARTKLEAEAERAAKNKAPEPWWDNALALLHLMPAAAESESAAIENQVENVAAYYEPTTRHVTVIAHPQRPDADPNDTMLNNMTTLAHELVHAIQDREMILKFDPTGLDQLFATKALIEGDAELYEYLIAIELKPKIKEWYPDPLAYTERLRTLFMADGPKITDGSDVNFATLGPPLLAAMYLVYPLGGMWLSDYYVKGGNSAVRHAYGKAPQRSLEYLLPLGTEAPPAATTVCKPIFPSDQGFTAYGRENFGAVQVFAYLMAWGVPSAEAVAAASLWRGDVTFVSRNTETQKTAVAWRIELAQPIAASTLAQINTRNGPRGVQDGNTLLITASDDAEVAASWNPTTACP
jgi:hypothetical protein